MNLFKKTTAAVALVTLVSGIFSTGVSAYSTSEVGAANALAEAGIINNHSDNSAAYNLDQNVLRQEIAAVARGIAGLPKATTYSAVFSDVTATTPNTWAWASVNALADAGLVAKNPTFRPEANISKAEAVGMVVKAAFGDAYAFDAAKGTTWQEQVVAFAVENGVVSSFTNYDTAATRGFVFEAGANALSSDDDSMNGLLEDLLGGLTDDEETTTDDETTVTTPVVDGDDVLEVALSPETPNLGWVAAATPRTALLSFDVSAGSEDVTLDEVRLDYTGLSSYAAIDNVKLYVGNSQVSKTGKNFTDKYIELSFENDTVVKAGETLTVTVTAEVQDNTTNVAHKVTLTSLSASSDVELAGNISSATFDVVAASNIAALDLDVTTVPTSAVEVGETIKLADFELSETNDNEDVVVKSITLKLAGSMDHQDDLSDIAITVDGKEVATGLTINDDEEIVADLDYTIAADENADFVVTALVIGGINETVSATLTEVFAVGAETGISATVAGVPYATAGARTIEGAEINVSFDKSDIDEARVNAEEVSVGSLTLSTEGEYNVTKLQVTAVVTGNSNIETLIKKLELDGKGYDSLVVSTGATTSTGVYTFEDISLSNEKLVLPLTFDVVDDTALNGDEVTFTAKLIEVEDEDNNDTYTIGGTFNLDDLLSTNALKAKTVTIENASVTFASTQVNAREVVLANGVETTVYKGKINVSDADDVTLNDINFIANTASNSGNVDFDKVIDSATLNIGGKTFEGDIDANSIDFSPSLVLAAGADNVQVLVTVVLKDKDGVANGEALSFKVDTASIDVEDSDNNNANLVTTNVNSNIAVTKLIDKGTFAIKVLKEVDSDDDLENTVLASTNGITLAELEIEADYEDVKVKNLVFTISGTTDFSSTIENVRLVTTSGKVLASAADVAHSGSTTITFDDDFIVADADDLIDAQLVADLNKITGKGDETTAVAGQIVLTLTTIETTGVESNDDLVENTTGTVASEAVTVVPTKLTFAIVDTLSNGSAKIKVIADSGANTVGTNDQTPEVDLQSLKFAELGNNTDGYKLYKEGAADIQVSATPVTVSGSTSVSFDLTSNASLDRTFTANQTYIIVPVGTVDSTYSLRLSGNVAVYDVQDNTGANVATGLTSTLDTEQNVGSKTY